MYLKTLTAWKVTKILRYFGVEIFKTFLCVLQVADCVCLMSLDKHAAIPVDTHVWQIAARDYMPQLKNHKSLTEKLYNQIGEKMLIIFVILMKCGMDTLIIVCKYIIS